MMHIGNEWDALLADEIRKDYYLRLREFLKQEYTNHRIYPPMEDIFNALRHTSYSDVRAVILGQDPYHGAGQAHGMCFSVKKGTPPPPALPPEHFQGDKGGARLRPAEPRRAHRLGGQRCAAAEHCSHRA